MGRYPSKLAWPLAIAMIVTACTEKAAPPPPHGALPPALASLVVKVESAPRQQVWDGTVEAVNAAVLSAQTNARVVELPYDVNDVVPAGAVLVRFSDVEQKSATRAAQAQIAAARATYANARVNYERIAAIAAKGLIAKAETVYVMGFRRAFPVSSYLAYSLQQLGKKTQFVDGVAGLARQQVQTMGPKDLLVAVSYQPYADETVQAVDAATARGIKVLAISDSLVSPIAKGAAQVLQVREAEVRSFRSLAASMCLAQALVIGFAFTASGGGSQKRRNQRP